MKRLTPLIAAVCCLTAPWPAQYINAQQTEADHPETLEWVIRQAGKADSLLHDAIFVEDAVDQIIKMTDCYIIFDNIAMAGLYCPEARAAAEAGREKCDIVNFRLDKDPVALNRRSMEARVQANILKKIIEKCDKEGSDLETRSTAFTPNDIIISDAEAVMLMLSDGIAVADLHLLAQKLEQSERILHDIEHLAGSLYNCTETLRLSREALQYCREALTAPNTLAALKSVQSAKQTAGLIRQSKCR